MVVQASASGSRPKPAPQQASHQPIYAVLQRGTGGLSFRSAFTMEVAMADQVPDPSRSYERARPEAESGMGRLDNNESTPTNQPDREKQAVKNKQPPRQ